MQCVASCIKLVLSRAALRLSRYSTRYVLLVCCHVLQCVTLSCSALQCVAVRCSVQKPCTLARSLTTAGSILPPFRLRPTLPPSCRVSAGYVAVSRSVLQCVAVFCRVLQCVALSPRAECLLRAGVSCSELHCVAVCCSVLQCVAACKRMQQCVALSPRAECLPGVGVLQWVALCCSVLQRSIVCCSVLHSPLSPTICHVL